MNSWKNSCTSHLLVYQSCWSLRKHFQNFIQKVDQNFIYFSLPPINSVFAKVSLQFCPWEKKKKSIFLLETEYLLEMPIKLIFLTDKKMSVLHTKMSWEHFLINFKVKQGRWNFIAIFLWFLWRQTETWWNCPFHPGNKESSKKIRWQKLAEQ